MSDSNDFGYRLVSDWVFCQECKTSRRNGIEIYVGEERAGFCRRCLLATLASMIEGVVEGLTWKSLQQEKLEDAQLSVRSPVDPSTNRVALLRAKARAMRRRGSLSDGEG